VSVETAGFAFALAYLICGGIVLCYELLTDDAAAGDIRDHGWPLAAVVVVGWPAFVWMVLRDEL